jgi:hypothetical protein
VGKSIDDIINFRFDLIRCKVRMSVFEPQKSTAFLDILQELSMGIEPTDSDATLIKKPNIAISLSDFEQPYGPSALLKTFKTSNIYF